MTKNRVLRFLMVLIVILGVSTCGSSLLVRQAHKEEIRRTTVTAIPTKTPVVFYKDTCPDCRRIFLEVYLCKLIKPRVCLVNLNNLQNQKYISRYRLKTVPTVINNNRRYSGTNYKSIALILLEGS